MRFSPIRFSAEHADAARRHLSHHLVACGPLWVARDVRFAFGFRASADPCGHEVEVTTVADVRSSYGEYVQFQEVSPQLPGNPVIAGNPIAVAVVEELCHE